jgi:hypothetical protein
MEATPCRLCGRLSRESRTRSGKHVVNAAKTPRWPLQETWTISSDFWASNGSICTTTVLLNASAIFKFCWDALGRTIQSRLEIPNFSKGPVQELKSVGEITPTSRSKIFLQFVAFVQRTICGCGGTLYMRCEYEVFFGLSDYHVCVPSAHFKNRKVLI